MIMIKCLDPTLLSKGADTTQSCGGISPQR